MTLQLRYEPRHTLHILSVLITKYPEISPLLDEHAEQEIDVRQDHDGKTVYREIRIEGKDKDTRHVDGVSHDAVNTGRYEILVREPLNIACYFTAQKIPPDLLDPKELTSMEIHKRQGTKDKARSLNGMHDPSEPDWRGPDLMVRHLADYGECRYRGDGTHDIVGSAVAYPHEGVAEEIPAGLLEFCETVTL